jgi:hypothetical protein
LHCLQLILRHGRKRVANRQIRGDEQRTQTSKDSKVADNRYAKQQHADTDDE